MAAKQKFLVGRASAVLTTGEVAGARINLAKCKDASLTVDLDFTIGSLTNVIVRFYTSMDGTTYKPVAVNGALLTETITANATRCYTVPDLNGWPFFRVSVQGTGTVTGSLCAFNYNYNTLWSA